jgi:hypothetical protein
LTAVQSTAAPVAKLRWARHHSAAGQPSNPVAAHLVDWFYVTSFFQEDYPQRGITDSPSSDVLARRGSSRIEKHTSFSYPPSICHPRNAAVKHCFRTLKYDMPTERRARDSPKEVAATQSPCEHRPQCCSRTPAQIEARNAAGTETGGGPVFSIAVSAPPRQQDRRMARA